MAASIWKKSVIAVVAAAAIGGTAYYLWSKAHKGPSEAFVSGNGRIEATEIDVATKLGGRVEDVLVKEGDFVQAGQLLARIQTDTLVAQRQEASAEHQQAIQSVASAQAQIAARESDKATAQAVLAQRESDAATALAVVSQRESDAAAAQAVVVQRESDLDAARRRFARSQTLATDGASSIQEVDDDRARVAASQAAVTAAQAQAAAAQSAISAARAQLDSAQAAITAAKAQVETAEATITAARAEVVGAQRAVAARKATIARVETDISDNMLKSPRDGRVQYLTSEPGEVLGGGGKVLNLVDLGDVYMTFFLPEKVAGQVALGSEARIVLDAAPQWVIPAKVSFVASTAQFTPKTVETASERQKLMFRVKAQIDRELLRRYLTEVKTGLPGVAWLRLDPNAQWPPQLTIKLPDANPVGRVSSKEAQGAAEVNAKVVK